MVEVGQSTRSVLPYHSLGVNEICHPCIHETQYPLSDPIQFAELPTRVAQHWVLRNSDVG